MFTGIIETCGEVTAIADDKEARRLEIRYSHQGRLQELQVGESIAVNGVCLTAVNPAAQKFSADISVTTLEQTTLQDLKVGDAVNLEPALRAGDALGGHLVSGHVDGVGTISSLKTTQGSCLLQICAPEALMHYLTPRGSVCVDGISLTVTDVDANQFGVTLIPHTQAATLAGRYQAKQRVNLEIDMLARYLERLLEQQPSP